MIVGDRPQDLRAALDFLAREGMDVILTSGGLGPTADDLTAEVVADFAGREMRLDEALEGRIAAILERLRARWRGGIDEEALRAGNRKQAMVPDGATVLEPVGTAPGLVVPADGATFVVLPGPPRRAAADVGARRSRRRRCRPRWPAPASTSSGSCGCSGRPSPRSPRRCARPSATACRSSGSRSRRACGAARSRSPPCSSRRPPATTPRSRRRCSSATARPVFARDGETIDELVAAALLGPPVRTVAVAESCTGGLMAGRLTDRAGSSAYVLGGLTVYSDEAKVALAGVDAGLIERHGAVSPEVAVALADGAIERLGAEVGIGITGIAGPGGGSEAKPVGMVCLSVAARGGPRIDRTVQLPGNRAMVRERTTTVVMHLLRRLLDGSAD